MLETSVDNILLGVERKIECNEFIAAQKDNYYLHSKPYSIHKGIRTIIEELTQQPQENYSCGFNNINLQCLFAVSSDDFGQKLCFHQPTYTAGAIALLKKRNFIKEYEDNGNTNM